MSDYMKDWCMAGTTAKEQEFTYNDLFKAMNTIKRMDSQTFNTMVADCSIVDKLQKVETNHLGLGIKVISDPNCYKREQIRFPRSKKKRIIKKWAKKDSNYKLIPLAFIFNTRNMMEKTFENWARLAF